MCRLADQSVWVTPDARNERSPDECVTDTNVLAIHTESLILAQDERWRRA